MNKFKCLQTIVIDSIIRSETISDVLKIEILSYFFFNLCWDFDYYQILSDIDDGSCDYKCYSPVSIPVGSEE